MLSNIRDILIISTPRPNTKLQRLLEDGSKFGLNLNYAVQPSPKGLAEAFIIGNKFIGGDNVSLVLGDNIFFGQNFSDKLVEASSQRKGATVALVTEYLIRKDLEFSRI